MARSLACIVLLLAASAQAQEMPSSVQVCFEGLGEIPLFAMGPQRNYRDAGQGLYVLDLELRFNGSIAPQRITRSGPNCLRAWMPARPLESVSVSFGRTDTNLRDQRKPLKLELVPEKWHDAGALVLERGPFSRVTSDLPGTLELVRVDGREPHPIDELSRVPAGRYQVRYAGTSPENCAPELVLEARGTIRSDTWPEVYAELYAYYRDEILPMVLKGYKLPRCPAGQHLEVRMTLLDGAYRHMLEPEVRLVRTERPPPSFEITVDGKRQTLLGDAVLQIGYGQEIHVAGLGPQAAPPAQKVAAAP